MWRGLTLWALLVTSLLKITGNAKINHSTLLWDMEGSCSVGTIGNISTEDNRECQINWQGAGISEKQFCTEQIQDFSTVYSMYVVQKQNLKTSIYSVTLLLKLQKPQSPHLPYC